jgi:hypothetical protein
MATMKIAGFFVTAFVDLTITVIVQVITDLSGSRVDSMICIVAIF